MTSTRSEDVLQAVVVPRVADLGEGFAVRRALPSAACRSVGPFVFFDEMGPVDFAPGHGLDVRPHPHIGLATVTYLFEGEILHRDSLGTELAIRPGEVNWMTAGRGIVHSERTAPERRARGARLAGVQLWVALPKEHEETEPAFAHHGADALPQATLPGARLRVILGEAWGLRSPVALLSEMLYVDGALDANAQLALPDAPQERAVYIVEGGLRLGAAEPLHAAGRLLVLAPGARATLHAGDAPMRFVLIAGAPLDGPRYLWWNFVSSSKARIEQAKADWAAQRFASVPGETEFIPLPPDKPPAGGSR